MMVATMLSMISSGGLDGNDVATRSGGKDRGWRGKSWVGFYSSSVQ